MRWLLPVVACLALVQLSGCAERSFEPIQSADWKPGYTFGYVVSADVRLDNVITEDGKVIEEDHQKEGGEEGGQIAYRVLNTELKHEGKPLYLVGMSGNTYWASVSTQGASGTSSQSFQTLAAYRQDTLEPVGVVHADVDCARCPSGIRTNTLTFYQASESHPWIKFPLKYQDTWTGSTQGMLGNDARIESSVRGMVTVDGPGGKHDVIRITHILSDPDADKTRQEFIAAMEGQGIQVNSLDFSQSLSVEVLYSPKAHNIVVQSMHVELHASGDFVHDGKHVVAQTDMSGAVTMRLVSYDLTEGPQVPVKDLGKALEVPIELPTVPGQEPTGTLRLSADQSVVNAAEKPSVRFTTQVTGNATAESYTIYDADGEAVAAGAGGDFTFKVKEPGTYKATVEGTDGNGRTLRSSTQVVADYQLTVPANCGLANVLGFPNCDSVDLPIRPGIQWLEVKATRTPVAVEPGVGELYLYDPNGGGSEFAMMDDNEATITIDSFDDYEFGDDWRLIYYPYAGVMEDVEYTVTLMHSQDGPGSGAGSFFDTLFEDAARRLTPGLFGLPA
jgi:hypothetical protein